jgi:osmoprotectant transport system permease protein
MARQERLDEERTIARFRLLVPEHGPRLTNSDAFETLSRGAGPSFPSVRLAPRAFGGEMETLAFILHNLPAIGERTLEHLSIVSVAVGVAIVTGVPIGIAITQNRRTADTILYLGSIVMTIPSIALFGVLIPILSKIGQGIGWLPAVIAAMLYAELPIIRNTYTAIRNVDPALRSAAMGMGMSVSQRLARVEIPIALPVIIAGVRIAVVINIGVTAIAAYIGAGGLGTFISRGISQSDIRQLITGALALGLLAIAVDYSLLWLQKRLTPRGLAPGAVRT